jgi:hypothetical protein
MALNKIIRVDLPSGLKALVFLLLSLVGSAHAQSIKISPTGYLTTAPGGTTQFTATVTGMTNQDVVWAVGRRIGGGKHHGHITANGLYTAPDKIPDQDPVKITAISKTKPSLHASVFINILPKGPQLFSVNPNPIPLGSMTLTLTGSGFRRGAEVLETTSSGKVTLKTISVTDTSIVATGWQGSASSATFTVTNWGSMPSNAVTVPVASGAQYQLTVVGGTGGGNYAAGATATITANPPPSGKVFAGWTGATVTNPNSTTTTLTMPAANATVTATYKAASYTLTVVSGTGGGSFAAGATATITANPPPSGQVFAGWTGATVENPNSTTTTLTMPAANTTVSATYKTAVTTYLLTVTNGTGGGNYPAGATVTVTANAPPTGQIFSTWTGAPVANPTSATTTLTMPAANALVAATYLSTYPLTVVNGSGSGTYAVGSTVTITANPPASGMSFANWTGAAVASTTSASTTLTMPGAATTVTANYSTNNTGGIPFPVASHPRLWVTQADLPRLRSWAVSTNPVYQQGMAPCLQTALKNYNTQFFPGGQPNPTYPDPGDTQGYTGLITEQNALILAFNSLIDPNPQNRITYAQDARNLLMYALNQAAQGPLAGAPFRDPLFCAYNRANLNGEDWGLIVDWIYDATDASGNPILTAADKATIQKAFLSWGNTLITASTTGGDHPAPVGTLNSLSLIGNGSAAYRMANNNYYIGHARLMTIMGLALDPSDDPPVDATQSVALLGNSVRSYLMDAIGAWLYQEYAMMGDPATVASDYGIPGSGAGLGLASGGTPPEGVLYGESFGMELQGLLALQTAGFNNVAYAGPQSHLLSAPVWSRFIQQQLSSITPTSSIPADQTYLGPVYLYTCAGDTLRSWCTPDAMTAMELIVLLEGQQGSTKDANAAKWFAANVPQGGLIANTANPWSWNPAQSVLSYMAFDPAAPAPTDPRSSLPLTFWDANLGQLYSRTDWGTNPTWFDYRATWNSINHQQGDAGQFELFRNGEWLTRGLANYDNNGNGQTTFFHNSLAIQNWCASEPPQINWWEKQEWLNGSQWALGENAGDPVTKMSSGTGYVYLTSDLTPLYNRPDIWTASNSIVDVSQANRSILWIGNDYVVVYDRATTGHSNMKSFNLCFANQPTTSGNLTTGTTPGGQSLYLTTLLPKSPVISSVNGATQLTTVSEEEPMKYLLAVFDPTKPADVRFLHVLQGANAGVPATPTRYVTSSSGTAFDGATFGSTAVYFPVSLGAVAKTMFLLPFSTGTVLIGGLGANTTYSATISGGVLTLDPSGTGATTDGAGLLVVKF